MDPGQRSRQLAALQAAFFSGRDERTLGRVADYPELPLLFDDTGVIIQQADGQKKEEMAILAGINDFISR